MGVKREYRLLGASQYTKANRSISILVYDEDQRYTGEIICQWVLVANRPVPQLQVFYDAWRGLMLLPDLIERLGNLDNANITPQRLVEILDECGFVDCTDS